MICRKVRGRSTSISFVSMLGMQSDTSHPLVAGLVRQLVKGERPDAAWLQICLIKPYEKEGTLGGSRFKVAMSDSRNYIQCMVVAPLAQAFAEKTLDVGDIVRLTSYQLNTARGQSFLVVGNAAVTEVVKGFGRIGEPVNISEELGEKAAVPQSTSIAPTTSPLTTPPNFSGTGTTVGNANTHVPPVPPPAAHPFHSNINSYEKKPTSSTSAPSGYCEEPESLQTIANLSPYHNRWAIKARIVNKTDIKRFANAKGEGKLFSATCVDASGEIRMTAFGDTVDRFFDMVQEGQVYCISNAQVKIAKRQFGVRNEYEIHLEPSSIVSLAQSGTESIPSIRYNFSPIAQIVNLDKDSNCDVIGVIREASDLGSITTKTTGKTLSKRDLTIGDTSGCSIRVTLWGTQAENFDMSHVSAIIAIKNARVGDYNGRTLSTSSTSTITYDPDIREAHELRGWFDARGIHEDSKPLTVSTVGGAGAMPRDDRKTIAQIKDEQLGSGEKPDYFSVLANITYIKSESTISYTACPEEGCNKKVTAHSSGPNMWYCEKCQKVFDRCEHRYILSLQIGDQTGQTWVNAFNETAEQLLGKSAEEMYYLKSSDEALFQQVFKEAMFKHYVFRIRAKQENYQGEQKLRCNILAALPVNAEEESRQLIEKLDKSLAYN